MAETGPTWWLVGPAAGLEVAAVVAAWLLLRHRRQG
jgi:LPXTG-motif cell wall-anchored protein